MPERAKLCAVRRILSFLVAAALLFTQVALSAYACSLPAGAPAVASAPEPDCCGGTPSPLCGAHCAEQAQAQERTQATLPVAPPSLAVATLVPALLVTHWAPQPARPALSIPPPGPDPSVLYCRLRI